MAEDRCPIWDVPCKAVYVAEHDKSIVTSERAGGRYSIDGLTTLALKNLGERERAALTDLIYEANLRGELPLVRREDIERAIAAPERPVSSRLSRLMTALARRSEHLGAAVRATKAEPGLLHAAASARNNSELSYLLKALNDDGLITYDGAEARITTKGYAWLADLGSSPRFSLRVFVAMWFDGSMDEAYRDGFAPAIADAGYEPVRIDHKEHLNKIDDEIIGEIRGSKFLVADFSCEPGKVRGGVYFEAGFAQGIGLPVIWTCRSDCVDDLHFDTRQYNHIVWSNPADLREKLSRRIIANIPGGRRP